MRTGRLVLSFVLIALLAKPPVTVLAQDTSEPVRGAWAAVDAVPRGDELVVKLKSGKSVKGRLSAVTDTGLTLTRENKSTDIERANVSKIHRVIGKSAKAKFAAFGAGAGAGVGLAIGAAKSSPRVDDSEIFYVVAVPLATGLGALVGAAIGAGRRKRLLVYEATD